MAKAKNSKAKKNDNETPKIKSKNEFKQCRNWCFTDFELQDYTHIYNRYSDIIRYICWGYEICPTTKKPHHQGWIQFNTKRTLGGVKRFFKKKETKEEKKKRKEEGKSACSMHFEACRGDEYDNDNYCKKDNNFKEFGKFISQGERTDLEYVKKYISEGHSMKEIADENFDLYCRYRSGITKYKEMCDKENSKKFRHVEVNIIAGETGTGKTKIAMEEASFKIEANTLNWWDGYEGDTCILIDEFANQIPITQLLNLLDGYQLRLPIKGGHTYAQWTKVFITSNLPWEEWYPNAKIMHKKALARRISKFATVGPTGNTITVGPTELNESINLCLL